MVSKITPPPQRGERVIADNGAPTRKFIEFLENLDPAGITEIVETQVQSVNSSLVQLQSYAAAIEKSIKDLEQQASVLVMVPQLQSYAAELKKNIKEIEDQGTQQDTGLLALKMLIGMLARPPKIGNVMPNDGSFVDFGMASVGAQSQQAHIADPTGVTTDEDVEARAAIDSILVVLETFGFTATS